MDFIRNPVVICRKIHEYIQEMTVQIRAHKQKGSAGKQNVRQREAIHSPLSDTLYHSETWDLCLRRCMLKRESSLIGKWHFGSFLLGLKLEKDFYNIQKDRFNISKVPDIYDSIKYDLLHNTNILQYPHVEDLYVCSKALADLVVPQVRWSSDWLNCASCANNSRSTVWQWMKSWALLGASSHPCFARFEPVSVTTTQETISFSIVRSSMQSDRCSYAWWTCE